LKTSRFLIYLASFVIGISLFQLGLVHRIESLGEHTQLSLWGIVVFSIYSLVLYYLSNIALGSSNKGLFTALHLGTIAIKMMITIGIVLIYKQQFQPEGKMYLLPFIILYICYTSFETWMLMKMSKTIPQKN